MDISAEKKPNIRAVALGIICAILLVVLIFYFPFVYLNFAFNFGNLPPQNIPYFLDAQVWPWSWFYISVRYGVIWWILFTDTGMLLAILFPYIDLYLEERRENTFIRAQLKAMKKDSGPKKMKKSSVFRWAILFVTGVGMVIQFLKAAYFVIGGLTCNQVQQCRLFSLSKGENSITPNGSYWLLMVCQILFFLLLLAEFMVFLPPPAEELVKTKDE